MRVRDTERTTPNMDIKFPLKVDPEFPADIKDANGNDVLTAASMLFREDFDENEAIAFIARVVDALNAANGAAAELPQAA